MSGGERMSCRVTRITDFTDRVRRFFVLPDAPFPFRAGQHVALKAGSGSAAAESPFSICSSPDARELEFYGSFQGDGPVAAAFRALGEGDVLELGPAEGNMTLDPEADRHLFIATVTGAGPFLSMIREAEAEAEAAGGGRKMTLIHGCRRSGELGEYLAELTDLADRASWFRYIPTVSRPQDDAGWTGETGRATEVLSRRLTELDLTPGKSATYVCGNPEAVVETAAVLGRAGIPSGALHMEEYLRGLLT